MSTMRGVIARIYGLFQRRNSETEMEQEYGVFGIPIG